MELVIVTNGEFEEEKALYDATLGLLIFSGDYYHDKIDERIDGFFDGLRYGEVDFTIREEYAEHTHELFDECGFQYFGGEDED